MSTDPRRIIAVEDTLDLIENLVDYVLDTTTVGAHRPKLVFSQRNARARALELADRLRMPKADE